MTAAVRYFTYSGSTKKLAEAVAGAVGVTAADTSADLTEKADVLFLGASLYKFTFDPHIADFLLRNRDKIGTVVCFGASASGKTPLAKLRSFAAENGIAVADDNFYCRGHFLVVNKDRPNADDLKAAGEFAAGVTGKMSE